MREASSTREKFKRTQCVSCEMEVEVAAHSAHTSHRMKDTMFTRKQQLQLNRRKIRFRRKGIAYAGSQIFSVYKAVAVQRYSFNNLIISTNQVTSLLS